MNFQGQFWVCIMIKRRQSLFKIWFHCTAMHTDTLTHTHIHTHTHTHITAVPSRLNRMLEKLLTIKSSQDEEIQAYISRMFGPSPHLPRLSPQLSFFSAYAGKPSCQQTTGWTVASCFITVLARSPHEKYFSWKINYNMSKWCLTKLNRRHAALLQIHLQSLGRETNKSTSSKSVTETQKYP